MGPIGFFGVALQLAAATASDAPLKAARAAQERFELTRRAHLPRVRGGFSRACDAVIGRYCYWYDSTETTPVPEPRRIAEARNRLLTQLDSLAHLSPADEWIAGQRVRYHIEAGSPDRGLDAARECRAASWWCSALAGLVHHVAERYPAADSTFDHALGAMPHQLRCEWMDLRRHVSGALASQLRRASCEARAVAAERLWLIGQPLWLVPGRDLRTEHFARLTMATILARSVNAHGMSWSSDSRELLLRYGWSEWFSRQEPSDYRQGPGSVMGHDREPSYYFFPIVESPRDGLTDSAWTLRDPTAPSRYAPRHVEWMGSLPHQVARFARGDSTRAVAVFRATDEALTGDSVVSAVGVLHDEQLTIHRFDGPVADVIVPDDSVTLSLELVGLRTKRAQRARFSLAPLSCGHRCLSDLLLFESNSADSVASLATALQRAHATHSFSNTKPLGVYWEIADRDESPVARAAEDSLVWAEIAVEPLRVSAARRMAARVRLARLPSAVRLRWRMRLASTGSLTLRLPAAAVGRYRVRLSLDRVGTSAREVTLTP